MKPIDLSARLNKTLSETKQREAVVLLVEAQLKGLVEILEQAPGLVEMVLPYNTIDYHIKQINHLTRAAYLGLSAENPVARTECEGIKLMEIV